MQESNTDDDLGGEETPMLSTALPRDSLERITTDSLNGTCHSVPLMDSSTDKPLPDLASYIDQFYQSMYSKSTNEWLSTFFPIWRWLQRYDVKTTLTRDVMAGITVSLMVVPQSVSYAKLAGLPVEFGLYGAFAPIFGYALFGTSHQLSIGPVSLISLLLNSGLSSILSRKGMKEEDDGYQEVYNRLAIQTALLVGISYVLMGLARLGFVTVFLSRAVISGFTSGAAIITATSQIKYIFGYDIQRSSRFHILLYSLFENIDKFNYGTFFMGSLCVITLMGLKTLREYFPKLQWTQALGPFLVTAAAVLLTVIFRLDRHGIPIVNAIPKGLPPITCTEWFPMPDWESLFPIVFAVVIVGFMQSIAVAKQFAARNKYEIDSSLELIGLGIANLAGSVFSAYPVTGSFSRSAVNNESGAKTGLSGIVTGCGVGLALLFLTPVFEKLPLCVLAAIVISGVIGLVEINEAIRLWKVYRSDFFVWILACLGTLFLGVDMGLSIAIIISVLVLQYEAAFPQIPILGRLPGTTFYRNILQYPEAECYDGILMVSVEAPLYFANAQHIRERLFEYRQHAADMSASYGKVPIKFVIIDLSAVSHMDTTALFVLDEMNTSYKTQGLQLCFSNPNSVVIGQFVSSGLRDKVGIDNFFASLHDAVRWCLMNYECGNVANENQVTSATGAPDPLENSMT